jgi:hypothetical protein
MSQATAHRPATERTIQYIKNLLDERELTASQKFADATQAMDEGELSRYMCQLRQRPRSMTQAEASEWIEALKRLPRKGTSQATGHSAHVEFKVLAEKVPAGRYAVTGEDGTTDFYRVDRPTDGRWKGYTFVKLGTGGPHGGELHWQRLSFKNTAAILGKIIADTPEAAAKRFGKEIGRCGMCGRTLTNPESIERGIGPVCAGNSGWSF